MKTEMFNLHQRAQWYYYEDGVVAMFFDTEPGPRTMAQGWSDCKNILVPFVCRGDMFRPWVVWNHNWNRPRVQFIRVLNKVYWLRMD